MNEQLLASHYERMCETLWAIKKSGDWKATCSSFDIYVSRRWSLSKTRAKLLCNFAEFVADCRKEYLRIPDAPENVKPILALAKKHWLDAWRLCVHYADGPINADHCEATLDHFGMYARKKLPPHVLNGQRVRRAAKTMAEFEDGEKLVTQIGADGLGRKWDDAVRVVIDADQARMNARGKP